jgi:hypothetical protein
MLVFFKELWWNHRHEYLYHDTVSYLSEFHEGTFFVPVFI